MLLLTRTAQLLIYALITGTAYSATLPPGFVYLVDENSGIELDLRYSHADNFVGTPIDGYAKPVAIMTRETAEALIDVQNDLQRFGLGLKIFDTYRPQRAVDHFVRWAKNWNDRRMQSKYYPTVAKKDLFREEYIAEKSGHSRGSTVDLTLIYRDKNGLAHELDMGTSFDFFDPRSWPNFPGLSAEQRANRMLLQVTMEKHGFKPYRKEWWHFTLSKEPFPDTYFNFTVE